MLLRLFHFYLTLCLGLCSQSYDTFITLLLCCYSLIHCFHIGYFSKQVSLQMWMTHVFWKKRKGKDESRKKKSSFLYPSSPRALFNVTDTDSVLPSICLTLQEGNWCADPSELHGSIYRMDPCLHSSSSSRRQQLPACLKTHVHQGQGQMPNGNKKLHQNWLMKLQQKCQKNLSTSKHRSMDCIT